MRDRILDKHAVSATDLLAYRPIGQPGSLPILTSSIGDLKELLTTKLMPSTVLLSRKRFSTHVAVVTAFFLASRHPIPARLEKPQLLGEWGPSSGKGRNNSCGHGR